MVVVEIDTDLMVQLVALTTTILDIYMLCCTSHTTLFNIYGIMKAIGGRSIPVNFSSYCILLPGVILHL